jgi:hypothetical protein
MTDQMDDAGGGEPDGLERAAPALAYSSTRDFAQWASLQVPVPKPLYEHTHGELDPGREYRQQLASLSPQVADVVRRRLSREAAAETGAVEGLYELPPGATRVIAAENEGWEATFIDQRGLGLFDAQLGAYDNVYNVAKSDLPLTEAFVRVTHEAVCKSQATYRAEVEVGGRLSVVDRPLPKGDYKNSVNYRVLRDGKRVEYTRPLDVEFEIRHMVEQAQSEVFADSHPVLQAAYVHYMIAAIHPFIDGNGRVARALSSLYTYRHCGLPLVIYADRKQAYFQALEATDKGKPQMFVDYIADRMEDTIGRAKQEIQSLTSESFGSHVADLLSLAAIRSELTIGAATEVANQIADNLGVRFATRISEVPEGQGLAVSYDRIAYYGIDFPHEYDLVTSSSVTFDLAKPAKLTVSIHLGVGVARDLGARFTFAVAAKAGEGQVIPLGGRLAALRYEDVYLSVGTGADARLALVVETVLAAGMKFLRDNLRNVLRQLGHGQV